MAAFEQLTAIDPQRPLTLLLQPTRSKALRVALVEAPMPGEDADADRDEPRRGVELVCASRASTSARINVAKSTST